MGISVICCACGKRFDERALDGEWLNRRCPLCGKRLSEELYDKAARELVKGPGVVRPGRGRMTARAKLDNLALARYYTSEWFRLACASRGSEAPDKGLYGLGPRYDGEGKLVLEPADDDRSPEGGWGRSAEYRVFDALRAEVARRKSPLAGARIVPCLMFPWLPGQKPNQWGARERGELDCVLMAESFALVVEVKRRNLHVKASADYAHVRERNEEGSFRSAHEVVDQVTNGAEAFAERQSLYPPERIFRMIAYVDPLSFTCKGRGFKDGLLVSTLPDDGEAPFIADIRALAQSLSPVATRKQIRALAHDLHATFGNTHKPRTSRIILGTGAPSKKERLTDRMLDALKQRIADEGSPLHGARLVEHPECEVQFMRKGKPGKTTTMRLAGLLLTRTHAVIIDARAWPCHVNTHVPFATVYTGDSSRGAKPVKEPIRHDWDLAPIGYENRSGTLTLMTALSRSLDELLAYQERNRACRCHVFVNPESFYSDCDDFRSRTFIGYWKGRRDNVVGALERLVESKSPIMTQEELDDLADSIERIGWEARP